MIRSINGDLLRQNSGIICHQTNYYGVMGGGIAYAIQRDLLTPDQYAEYEKYCRLHGRGALGTVQFIRLNDGRYLANMFSQDDDCGKAVVTDYGAFREAADKVERFARKHNLTVAFPSYIGCGIAGGNWITVSNILDDIFSGSPVKCTIVYKK